MQAHDSTFTSHRALETPQKKTVNSGSLTRSSQQSMKFRFSYEKVEYSSSKYTSMNLNYLLGSELKFKSPSKLIEVRVSESPWANNTLKYKTGQQIYSFSPLFASEQKEFIEYPIMDGAEHNAPYQNLQEKFLKVVDFGQDRKDDNQYNRELSDENLSSISRSCSKMSSQNGLKKRKRKSSRQLEILMEEFTREEDWSKEKISKMAEITGLTESQVYKWCWDQKKKATCKGSEIGNDRRCADLFPENLNRIKTVKEKAELLERLGKRKPFGVVNDSRLDRNFKQIKF